MSAKTHTKKVLIVGAGIAGLALARSLEQRGVDFDIIERSEVVATQGYSVTIPHGGLGLLRQLGLYDEVRAVSAALSGVQLHLGSQGRSQRTVAFREDEFDVMTLRRADLHAILLNSLKTKVRYATTISCYDVQPDGAVVSLSDGSKVHYGLVVGADGLHSAVRTMLWPHATPQASGVAFWTFFTPGDLHKRFDNRAITQYWHEGLFAGVFPLPSSASVVLSMRLSPSVDVASINIAQQFSHLSPELQDVLTNLDDASVYRGHLHEVKLPKWHKYPFVLIGDAAHAMMPATGMGSSAGIADAVALGDQLEAQEDWTAAVRKYETSRRTHSYVTQRISRVVTDTMLSSGVAGSLNQTAARLMPSSAVVRLFR